MEYQSGKIMKRTLFITMLLFSIGSFAQESELNELNGVDRCEKLSTIAEDIMERRQAGEPMSQTYRNAEGNEVIEGLIMEAYDWPRYDIESMQIDRVVFFRDYAFSECIKAMRELEQDQE